MTNIARILIIEDDPTIRETLSYLLRKEGFEVIAAGNSRDGLKILENQGADLLLLDVMLPDVDGFTLCRSIRAINNEIKILMVTALAEKDDVIKGISLGADDYITKPYNVDELLARIRAHLRRGASNESSGQKNEAENHLLSIGDIEIDLMSHSVKVAGNKVSLTIKEFEMLRLLIENPSKAFTRRELASLIWHEENQGKSRTVDAHINHLRTKVERISSIKLIETIHGFGYKFSGQERPANK